MSSDGALVRSSLVRMLSDERSLSLTSSSALFLGDSFVSEIPSIVSSSEVSTPFPGHLSETFVDGNSYYC